MQEFTVRKNGRLEILPELFIPQRGACHRQRTQINVESAGELIFLETIAPGRVASGEIFAFKELDWLTEIRLNNNLIVRERFTLSPQNKSLRAWRRFSLHPYVATFFLVTERLQQSSACWKEIDTLHSEGLWTGTSRLVAGGWAIKIVASDSNRLRQAVSTVRERIHDSAGWSLPLARKL
jgi:urease accessory protein